MTKNGVLWFGVGLSLIVHSSSSFAAKCTRYLKRDFSGVYAVEPTHLAGTSLGKEKRRILKLTQIAPTVYHLREMKWDHSTGTAIEDPSLAPGITIGMGKTRNHYALLILEEDAEKKKLFRFYHPMVGTEGTSFVTQVTLSKNGTFDSYALDEEPNEGIRFTPMSQIGIEPAPAPPEEDLGPEVIKLPLAKKGAQVDISLGKENVSPIMKLVPGDYGIRVEYDAAKKKNVFKISNDLYSNFIKYLSDIRTIEDFLMIVQTAHSTAERYLDWTEADVQNANALISKQLKGYVSKSFLNISTEPPPEMQLPLGGARNPIKESAALDNNIRSENVVDKSVTLSPGDYGIWVQYDSGKDKNVFKMPENLFKKLVLQVNGVTSIEDFVSYTRAMPSTVMTSLDWSLADVRKANELLQKQLVGFVNDRILNPPERPKLPHQLNPNSGALPPKSGPNNDKDPEKD
jgi:hypothetical protein